ncbi:expressed unknown protein [Seminavis robusta]|uniref:CHAT domain-containing protein n=1 Tax=Seminavis robusta TaxID=568900 RepID=A0A9N8DPD6_9STRA|nr:expressed unknown protein [Seminavis robusta]|eukprot:Sro275_g105740.1 n/a (1324) ;mRNA; f:45165-49136
MTNNESLCKDGCVLTGKDLERYSRRKGLCHLCARFATHKRAGKLFKRNKWQPLTIQNEYTGEYLVYKGYCLQPTCYTLDQAKEALGEKPIIQRKSITSRRDSSSLAAVSSSVRSDSKDGAKQAPQEQPIKPTSQNPEDDPVAEDDTSMLSLDVLQLLGNESLNARGLNGHAGSVALSPLMDSSRGDKNDAEAVSPSQFNASHKWSREVPCIRLPSFAESRHSEDGKKSCDQSYVSDLAGTTEFGCSSHDGQMSQLQPPKTGHDLKQNEEQMNELDKTIKDLLGLSTPKERSQGDDPTVDSSDSVSTTTSILSQIDSAISFDHTENLPGCGFVSYATEGNYRAALDALDLAPGATQESKRASIKIRESGDLQALCLQSKQLDHGDIELVAVTVDSEGHWLSPDFLLEDETTTEIALKRGNERMIVVGPSGSRLVELSHVCADGGMEELEVETDLNQFARLDLYSQEALDIKSRASLEAEINNCEEAITSAQVSDDPTIIEKGILSRSRLGSLLPLRKFYRPRKKLEKKVKKITRKLEALEEDDLDRRYVLATEKCRLSRQITAEKVAEELRSPKAQGDGCEAKDDAQSTELATRLNDVWPQNGVNCLAEPFRSVTSFPDDVPPHSDVVNATIELDAERSVKFDSNENALDLQTLPSVTEVHMTVFQSAPLAYVDRATGTHHVCPLLDFEYEARALTQSLKEAEIAGARMDVQFDIATTDRLSAFLAKSESRVMHLSCHGHPDYLALEDGFGGMQILPVRDLKRFIAAGVGNLEVVFVSACHSKAAGKAFLKAGIRHVICCRQDDKFRDEGAIEFARSFYRALALKNTVKQAFNMAREAMRVSPMVKDSKAEYEKFILLPQLPSGDPYHDVHIFTHPTARSDESTAMHEPGWKRKKRIIPRTPQFFIGREMDMYTILEALRSNDIIHVQGPPEIGKSSLVAATTRYIEQRHKSFLFDETVWLPVQEGSAPSDDQLYSDLSKIFELISKASRAPCQREQAYAECWSRTLHQLHDKRPLIVIHRDCLCARFSMQSLDAFIRQLLKVSNAKLITVGIPLISGLDSAVINVEALDFDATILLFARLSRSASITAPQIITSLTTALASSEDHDSCRGKLISWRRKRVYERLGAGVPTAIRKAALDIPDDELSELLRAAQRPFVDVESRSDLDAKISELEMQECQELKGNKWLLARDTRETIEELECLCQSFPTLQDLLFEEKELEDSLQTAVSVKQYDNACQLQKRLDAVKQQILNERSTAPATETVTAEVSATVTAESAAVTEIATAATSVEVEKEADADAKTEAEQEIVVEPMDTHVVEADNTSGVWA